MKKTIDKILVLVIVTLPILLYVIPLKLFINVSTFNYLPIFSDEVDYWREILSFSNYGFNFGNYSIEEHLPKLVSSHFGAHGFSFVALYGSMSKVLGWHPYSAPLFNVILISLSLLLFMKLVNPDTKQLILVILILILFPPILLYLPITMEESLHYSIAIVIASLFYNLINNSNKPSKKIIVFAFLFIFLSGIFRLTWAFLFFPFFYILHKKDKKAKGIVMILFKSIMCIFIIFFINYFTSAPYPYSFISSLFITLKTSKTQMILLLFKHSFENLSNYFKFSNGNKLEVIQRYEVLSISILCFIVLLKKICRNTMEKNYDLLFNIFNLLFIVLLNIIFYDLFSWRDFRVIAPHLLCSLFLLICFKRNNIIYLVLILCIFTLPPTLKTYIEFTNPHYTYNLNTLENFNHDVSRYIKTSKDEPSGWNNTLLVDIDNYNTNLISIDSKIGISLIIDSEMMEQPIKSKYILLSEKSNNILINKNLISNYKLLSKNQFGYLYKANTDE